MTIKRKNYSGIPLTGSPHFHSGRTGDFLFLAGATAKMTSAENGTMADQTRVIFERMKYILECEGGSLGDVVKMTSYVTDLSESAKSQTQKIRREYFGESLPSNTGVQVAGLDGPSLLIEIDAIAMIPEE